MLGQVTVVQVGPIDVRHHVVSARQKRWLADSTDGDMKDSLGGATVPLVTRQHRWWLACGLGSVVSAGARRTDTLAGWVFPAASGTEALDPSPSCRLIPDTAGTSRDRTCGDTTELKQPRNLKFCQETHVIRDK